jgi:hypothetical protein
MDFKKVAVLAGFVILIMLIPLITFAEETAVVSEDPVVTSDQQAVAQNENDTQWAWGEVTNVDNQAKTFTLKYLDYEADQEKELVLTVDEKTTFENIKGFDEIKIKDTLSIDYLVGVDNKNIAKNVSFEKPDSLSSVSEKPVDEAQSIVQSETPAALPAIVDEASEPESTPVVQSQIQ